MQCQIIYILQRLLFYKTCYVVRHNLLIRYFWTLVLVHLLQSHCTRGLQHPTQSNRKLTGPRLPAGFHTCQAGINDALGILSKKNMLCPVHALCQSNADSDGTHIPEWAIYCLSNFGAQRAHKRSNQHDCSIFICQVKMVWAGPSLFV